MVDLFSILSEIPILLLFRYDQFLSPPTVEEDSFFTKYSAILVSSEIFHMGHSQRHNRISLWFDLHFPNDEDHFVQWLLAIACLCCRAARVGLPFLEGLISFTELWVHYRHWSVQLSAVQSSVQYQLSSIQYQLPVGWICKCFLSFGRVSLHFNASFICCTIVWVWYSSMPYFCFPGWWSWVDKDIIRAYVAGFLYGFPLNTQ